MTPKPALAGSIILLLSGASAPGVPTNDNAVAQQQLRLPHHACVRPDSTNPVYYETSSGEWSWSPDGSAVVYSRAVGAVSQIRVQHVGTGSVQCITRRDSYDTHPNWSPTGERIAFVRQIDGVPQIHFLAIENEGVEAVTDRSGGSEYPAFSHDGSMLAYLRLLPDDSRRRLLIVRDLATGIERTVFDSPLGLNNLSWTPGDTAVLLYSIDDDGWNDIYAAKADGSGVTRLTDNTVTDSYTAEYSPDGSRLLFGQGSEDSPYSRWYNYDLYEQTVATGEIRRMTLAYGPDDRGHYSPDGRTIGFLTRRHGYAEVMMMDADGGNLRFVTRQPESELASRIREHGVAAGEAYFGAIRRTTPDAQLIGERAAFILTRQLLARGEIADAVAVARIGIATYPNSWQALTALGEALLAAGDHAAALDRLQQSLRLSPNQAHIVFLLGLENTIELLDAIDGIWRDKAGDIFELANWLRRRGDFLTALTLLRRLDRVHPNDVDILSRLARTQMMLGDHAGAIATYERVLRVDPDHEDARAQITRLRQLGQLP